jgi:hypothetical protein
MIIDALWENQEEDIEGNPEPSSFEYLAAGRLFTKR